MGNNAAPTLASIYMNFVETKILQANPNIIFCKRYLDDVLLIYKGMDDLTLLHIVPML